MRSSMRLVSGGCLFAAVAFATTAHAQGDATKRAELLFRQGLDLVDAASRDNDLNKYDQARRKFEEAYDLAPRASLLFNLARSEHLTGRLLEAQGHYRAYLAGAETPRAEEAKQHVAALAKQISRIVIEAPAGTNVRIDGAAAKPVSSEPIDVLLGTHKVEAEYRGQRKVIEVVGIAGHPTVAHFDFAATTTSAALPPPAVSRNEEQPTAIAPTDRVPPPRASPAAKYIVVGGMAVVGAGALVAGGLFGAASTSARDEFALMSASKPCANPASAACAALNDKVDAENRNHTLSVVSLIAGSALLGGAAITWFAWNPNDAGVSVSPHVGRGRAFVEAKIRF